MSSEEGGGGSMRARARLLAEQAGPLVNDPMKRMKENAVIVARTMSGVFNAAQFQQEYKRQFNEKVDFKVYLRHLPGMKSAGKKLFLFKEPSAGELKTYRIELAVARSRVISIVEAHGGTAHIGVIGNDYRHSSHAFMPQKKFGFASLKAFLTSIPELKPTGDGNVFKIRSGFSASLGYVEEHREDADDDGVEDHVEEAQDEVDNGGLRAAGEGDDEELDLQSLYQQVFFVAENITAVFDKAVFDANMFKNSYRTHYGQEFPLVSTGFPTMVSFLATVPGLVNLHKEYAIRRKIQEIGEKFIEECRSGGEPKKPADLIKARVLSIVRELGGYHHYGTIRNIYNELYGTRDIHKGTGFTTAKKFLLSLPELVVTNGYHFAMRETKTKMKKKRESLAAENESAEEGPGGKRKKTEEVIPHEPVRQVKVEPEQSVDEVVENEKEAGAKNTGNDVEVAVVPSGTVAVKEEPTPSKKARKSLTPKKANKKSKIGKKKSSEDVVEVKVEVQDDEVTFFDEPPEDVKVELAEVEEEEVVENDREVVENVPELENNIDVNKDDEEEEIGVISGTQASSLSKLRRRVRRIARSINGIFGFTLDDFRKTFFASFKVNEIGYEKFGYRSLADLLLETSGMTSNGRGLFFYSSCEQDEEEGAELEMELQGEQFDDFGDDSVRQKIFFQQREMNSESVAAPSIIPPVPLCHLEIPPPPGYFRVPQPPVPHHPGVISFPPPSFNQPPPPIGHPMWIPQPSYQPPPTSQWTPVRQLPTLSKHDNFGILMKNLMQDAEKRGCNAEELAQKAVALFMSDTALGSL